MYPRPPPPAPTAPERLFELLASGTALGLLLPLEAIVCELSLRVSRAIKLGALAFFFGRF
jgi:hypothetical protein